MCPIDYSGGSFKEFGPKVGESKVIHIREANRVEDSTCKSEDNFKNRTKNFGFRYELTLTNSRIFLLNVWKLFFEFKAQDVQDGDKIQIDHPGEGVYKVTVLEKGTGIGVEVEDIEKKEFLANKAAGGTGAAPAGTGAAPAAPVVAPVTTPPAGTVTPSAPVVTPQVKAQPAASEEMDLPF